MSYTHLQIQSGYSLLESTIKIEKLIKRASELQFDALALTDHEVLHGVIPFYTSCQRVGIKPIIGMTIDVLNINEREQCIFLAKNNQGYQKLLKLSTMINRDKKIIDVKKLHAYADHLICILPIQTEVLSNLLLNNEYAQVKNHVDRYVDAFAYHDFYIGIQDHGSTNVRKLHQKIKSLQELYNFNVVAINDVRYLKEEDYVALDCLQSIKENKRWIPSKNSSLKRRHLRSIEEMNDIFIDFWPEVLQETEKIKQKCNVSIEFNQSLIPSYPTPNHLSAHRYLEKLCWNNIEGKFKHVTKKISDRLVYELEVIETMGFSDYFLIVWDFIKYAKDNNILVGPGRGSAAGSIVAYILGITEVNPIKYGLLFERFLNPERISMPDIDVDFSDHRREEVIHYVRQKYGEDHVAQIITFGTFGARSILRELFKTMGIDQQDMYYILNEIPAQANKSIIDYMQKSHDLNEYIKQSEKLRLLFQTAITLEGLPRHISTHAAGVVISEKKLTNYVPLTVGGTDSSLTQYPMDDLESLGLLKMDFLGLRNLTFIEKILNSIYFETNERLTVNNIPEHDDKTYKLLQQGKTNGIFQLESRGMKQVLRKLQPNDFDDIVAVNALYRPGPMDNIQIYIERKQNVKKASYIHPDLKPILERTYGVLIYQEQIMQIAHQMAGFSLGEADILRRAISKTDPIAIEEKTDEFIEGCVQNGYSHQVAKEIFLWILKFSSYGFNRSHAVAYSKISYQLAYLKANYTTHFFAELLSSFRNDTDKTYQYINEARALKIKVLPPVINKSYGNYSIENKSIRMGLLSVKGIGHQIVKEILEERKNGLFTSVFDFCLRVPLQIINRKVLELLILSGCFDEIHENRASLLASIDQAIEQGELFREFNNQTILLNEEFSIKEEHTKMDDFSQIKKLMDEKDLLGVYVSSHPLKEYRAKLQNNHYYSLIDSQNFLGNKNVKSAVVIQKIKKIRTKRGDPMAFIVIGDETLDMEAVVFPELYRKENRWLKEEMIVYISGVIEKRNNSLQWILSTIRPFDNKLLQDNQRIFIKVSEEKSESVLTIIKDVSRRHSGETPVFIYHKKSKQTFRLTQRYNIQSSQVCLEKLYHHFGKENVVLQKENMNH